MARNPRTPKSMRDERNTIATLCRVSVTRNCVPNKLVSNAASTRLDRIRTSAPIPAARVLCRLPLVLLDVLTSSAVSILTIHLSTRSVWPGMIPMCYSGTLCFLDVATSVLALDTNYQTSVMHRPLCKALDLLAARCLIVRNAAPQLGPPSARGPERETNIRRNSPSSFRPYPTFGSRLVEGTR